MKSKNKCPRCHGTGKVLEWLRAWHITKGMYKMVEIRTCSSCAGTGEANGD